VSNRLHDLDARHLPRLASWLRARVERYGALRDRVTVAAEAWEPQALDTRYGGRLPFSVLRGNPTLALAVTGAVLAAGLATALVKEGGAEDETVPGVSASELFPQGDGPEGIVLGARIGENVVDYLKRATDGLLDAVRVSPGAQRVALVSIRDYRTPEQARVLLSGFTVKRVFLRSKDAGKYASTLPVELRGPLLPALKKAYADTARNRVQAQRSFESYARTLRPRTDNERRLRELYLAYGQSSGIEARDYGHSCACVFAALVTASPAQLLSLNARAGIRSVQVAGSGVTVLQVQAQPLLPEVEGIVPRPSFAGLS
jgi:hypothetical protein